MSYTTPEALGSRALHILDVLCVTKDFEAMPALMDTNVKAIHDDNHPLVGRDEFISHWKMALTRLTNLEYEVYDHVSQVQPGDLGGGKVWVFSRLTGLPGGLKKDSVDMLEIDAEGKLLSMKDVQRTLP